MEKYYLLTAIQESKWFNTVTEMSPAEWLMFWEKQVPTILINAIPISEDNFKILKETIYIRRAKR